MKPCLISLVFLFSSLWLSAQEQSKTDTVYLDEVKVVPQKALHIKTKGRRGATRGLQGENSQFVTLVSNIPPGDIGSVTFYFRTAKPVEGAIYELELLVFSVGDDGLPGKPLASAPMRFHLRSGKKDKITLDLSPLQIQSESELFFGFGIIDNKAEMPLIVHFWETTSEVSFFRDATTAWKRPVGFLPELKMDIAIYPDR